MPEREPGPYELDLRNPVSNLHEEIVKLRASVRDLELERNVYRAALCGLADCPVVKSKRGDRPGSRRMIVSGWIWQEAHDATQR